MLSYIHVDGDFNPWRVTVARVHGGLHHEGSTKNQPCLSHHGHRPQRTCLTRGRSSGSRRSPCSYKLLCSTPQDLAGFQVTPNQSRRHHSPKGNRCVVDDELLASMLQMIVSSTLNHSLTDLAWVREGLEWKATWGRLEIKVQMVGLKSLGLNT